MKSTHLPSRPLIAAVTIAAGLAACRDSITNPGSTTPTRVAVTTNQGGAALFLQDVGGSNKTRLRFASVTDVIQGNPADVVVSESSVQSLGTPVWDPAGGRIAVTAEVSNHALILVMRADGTGGEVASSDTMLIGSDPQWSPDGRRIAYTMSTLSNLDVHDIYVTDLTTHAVTRVTTGAHAVAASIGWSPDGAAVIYSHATGSTGDEPDNLVSELVKVDVSSGASQTLVTGIVGQITGIARSGDRVLISRGVATSGGGSVRELIEVSVGGSEHVLADSAVWSGHYTTGDDAHAVLVTATGTGNAVNFSYEILDVANGRRTPVGGVAGQQAGIGVLTHGGD
jgi:hypothetical protein